MRTSYKAVTRARRCPVCDGDHKCAVGSDGSIQCGRVPDGLHPGDRYQGFVFMGRSEKDEQFGLFRVENDPVLREREEERRREREHQHRRPSANGTASHGEDGAGDRPDMNKLARRYVAGLTAERAAELAEALGLRVDVLARLPLLGYFATDPHGPCWTFPETDGAGRIIGISRRYANGRKLAVEGGGRGLTLPDGWDTGEGPVFAVEGPSDTMALAALGLSAVGRPSNTGGVSYLAELLKHLPDDRDIIVVAEYDGNDKGLWPGLDGAKRTAAGLAEALGRPVKWALPPKGHKDTRAWVVAQHLPADCLDAWHDAGEQLAAMLLEKAQDGQAGVAGRRRFGVVHGRRPADDAAARAALRRGRRCAGGHERPGRQAETGEKLDGA